MLERGKILTKMNEFILYGLDLVSRFLLIMGRSDVHPQSN